MTDVLFGNEGDDDPFWVKPAAAAVLKHGILARHVPVFSSKTGSTSAGGRVAFLDGYAGRGRYDDGTPASAEIALQTARKHRDIGRDLRCLFVEKDPKNFAVLSAVANEYDDVRHMTRRGMVEDHLDEVLAEARDIPLLAFLDPYGLTMGIDTIAKRFFNERPQATDLLLNLSAKAISRGWGVLTSPKENRGRERAVTNLNQACGGTWWQDTFREAHMPNASTEIATRVVAREYASRLASAAGAGGWTIPVKKKEHLQPVYYLVFLSRHRDGMYVMAEHISLAQADWRRELNRDTIFDSDAFAKEEEKALGTRWSQEILELIVTLMAQAPSRELLLADQLLDVLGPLAGVARMTHVNKARDRLASEGYLTYAKTGAKPWDQKFTRTGSLAPR